MNARGRNARVSRLAHRSLCFGAGLRRSSLRNASQAHFSTLRPSQGSSPTLVKKALPLLSCVIRMLRAEGKPGIRKEKRANGFFRLLVFMFNICHTKSEAGKAPTETEAGKDRTGVRRKSGSKPRHSEDSQLCRLTKFCTFRRASAAGGVPL